MTHVAFPVIGDANSKGGMTATQCEHAYARKTQGQRRYSSCEGDRVDPSMVASRSDAHEEDDLRLSRVAGWSFRLIA